VVILSIASMMKSGFPLRRVGADSVVHRSMIGSYFTNGAIVDRKVHSDVALGVPTVERVAEACLFKEDNVI